MACRLKVSDIRVVDDGDKAVEIAYQGSKSCWRSSTNIDLIIMRFDSHSCLEIISYDPFMNQEAPRIYVDLAEVMKKIEANEFNTALAAINESFVQNKSFNAAAIEKKAWNGQIAKYITARITVDMNQKAQGKLCIFLKPVLGDAVKCADNNLLEDGGVHQPTCLDVVMKKPVNLDPTVTSHLPSLRISIVMTCLTTFQESTQLISAHGAKAVSYLNVAKSLATFARLGHHKTASSVALGRWKKAVNKVINLEMVKKVRIVLAVHEMKREAREAKEAALRENPASVAKKVMRRPQTINTAVESPVADVRSLPGPLPLVRATYEYVHTNAADDDNCLHDLPSIHTPKRVIPATKPFFTSPRAALAASKAASISRLERQQSSNSIHLFKIPIKSCSSSSSGGSVPFLPYLSN